MDKNQDGFISEEEFLEGCEKVGTIGSGWQFLIAEVDTKRVPIIVYNVD